MTTDRNTSTASRLAKTPASGKALPRHRTVTAAVLAQSKGAKVGRALAAASKTVGAFGNKNAGE